MNTVSFTNEQLQASADDAPAVARAAGAAAESLISAWVRGSNAAAVDAVAQRGEGHARKAARRGLNVLKARGVAIPRATRKGTIGGAAAVMGRASAWLLPPDVQGNGSLVLARPDTSGRYQASFIFFHDGQRVLRVQNGLLSLSKLKEQIERARGGSAYSAVSVPWGWAQYRVLELRRWHAERNVPEPLGFSSVTELLADAPSAPPLHPFDEEGLVLSDEDAAERAKGSAALHRLPEFQPWLPTPSALEELLIKIGSRLGGGAPPEKEAMDTIVREEVLAATDRYFTSERRARIVERLKDCGISVMVRQGEEAGLLVAAVIRAVQQAGLITNPASEIGFLRAFFDKGLAFMASRSGGQLRVPVPQDVSIGDAPGDVPSTPDEAAAGGPNPSEPSQEPAPA
jgi:hypothetical protein